MATSFDVFYLGNLADIDPTEGDATLDTVAVNTWLGTYGGPGNGLSGDIVALSPGGAGYGGGISSGYDTNNNSSNDQMLLDGVLKTHDATMLFDATITYPDGSTQTVTAVLFQTTDGDVYLSPEISNNADEAALEAGPIQSITLNAPLYAGGVNGQGYYLFGDRAPADFVPCFTLGTRIATATGERNVEDLRIGDRVFTRDNGVQTLRWIGRRDLNKAALAQKPDFMPVLIQKDALGHNLPERDLLVSPNHRILVTGPKAELFFEEKEVLVAAKYMTDLPKIDVVQTSQISYIHIMFERHEVVLSNGAWTESFQPADYAIRGLESEQQTEIFELFPELSDLSDRATWSSARRVLKRHEAQLLFS